VLLDATPFKSTVRAYAVGDPKKERTFESIFDELVTLIAERNPDFYQVNGGKLERAD
jgi:hypothetical protein